MANLPQINVSFDYSLHRGGNTLHGLHYWAALNLTEIHHDLVGSLGIQCWQLLSLCLHSGTLGPPQQSQVRGPQHLHHRMLTLPPQFQHVRRRNSLLGGTACISEIFPKWGKRGLEMPLRNLSIFQGNLSIVLSTIWLKLVIGKQNTVLAHADTVPL